MTRAIHTRHSARLVLALAALSLAACTRQPPVFKLLSPQQTGVTFANTITATDSLNAQTDPYVYNGAGVAVGDFNNDGLPDLFFAGNQVSSRLYLNKGHFHFEDVTAKAGVTTTRWVTGVSLVDINDDGWLDIYLSVSGPPWAKPQDRANLLFVNNHDGTFTEEAAKYGIADTGFTTHAVFLDYNGDGCVDLFLLENAPQDFNRGEEARQMVVRGQVEGSYNQLYRNNCDGTFTNVSKQAGIESAAGYGLGVAVADFNGDGRPDIYVSSDIDPNDMLFINNGDGTFTNRRADGWVKHTSYAGMGIDVADVNNDGWPDLLQVDMMPPELSGQKKVSGFMSYASVLEARGRGQLEDYDVNSLQLSNGRRADGAVVFSEIAHMAGVAYTDWSWAPLLADFDDDGYKDVFISNGYPKAVNDFDYVIAATRATRSGDSWTARKILRDLQGYRVPNYVFRNDGGLTFTDETKAWGLDQPSYSYGAAYADLDNDGKLDLVVNNIDAPASIYENVRPDDAAHHYLTVELDGLSPNRRGLGATVAISAGGKKQYLYESPYRGFMSTVDDRLHFGLGRAARVDSLEVRWPDGRWQVLTDVAADRMIVVRQADAAKAPPPAPAPNPWHRFDALDAHHRPAYTQQLSPLHDYEVQPLLPYLPSREGPPLAVADVNGDGLDDVFIGGAAGVPGKLFLQQKDGSFVEADAGQPWTADSAYDAWGALFFDANGDGKPDLYVASCNYQLVPGSPLLQDHLYINVGGGRFVRDSTALPPMRTCTGTVRAGDFNGDGRPDLFVGGPLTPRKYPYPTRSYILRNDGGRFTDVTAQVAPELVNPGGMITDAAWVDFDGDGRLDLVTAGQWMPIRFLHNDGTRFRDVTSDTHLPPMRGWWYSLAVGDLDHDGRPDLVAGNLGLNFTYTTSKDSHFGVYAGDFTSTGPAGPMTANRPPDIVLTKQVDGAEYPIQGLAELGPVIFPLALRYPTYGLFAQASMQQAFTADQLQHALHYEADTFASMVLHNDGHGRFTATPLPAFAQIAPIRGIVVQDVDGDGNPDLIVAGNLFDTDPNTPRADAGNGLWLKGDGHGHFLPVPPAASGFLAPLDVSGLHLIRTATGLAVLVANTGDSLQAFAIRR